MTDRYDTTRSGDSRYLRQHATTFSSARTLSESFCPYATALRRSGYDSSVVS